ncbi:MAG: DUF4177 domain-containing protein [Candidatus Coproplasma sp.]
MKEYKVELAKNLEKAEELMNELAKEGWRVVSTAFLYYWKVGLSITFEREKAE